MMKESKPEAHEFPLDQELPLTALVLPMLWIFRDLLFFEFLLGHCMMLDPTPAEDFLNRFLRSFLMSLKSWGEFLMFARQV
jgi:hypothetical protein